MARDPDLSRAIRRRRVAAITVFAIVLAAAGGISWVAVHRPAKPAPVVVPPPPKPFRIVFPEGFTRVQMAVRVRDVARIAVHESHAPVRLNEAAYLAASRRAVVPCFGRKVQHNLEGFLFPATYDFLATTTSRQLVRDQIQAFCRNWRQVGLAYAKSRDLTPYDVLKIGSMIEREAAVASERPLMSAVIYNRLHDRMQLGIDATLRYGLHIPPTKSITESELQSDNPYNTRKFFGLPPTPIANPGLASLKAAAHPANVDYLYFVRKPDKRHDFFTASATAFDQYLATHGYK
jgi:peptidoglycan lytic transglycosylase G